MPSLESTDYTGLPYVGCVCGHCRIDDDASYGDFALTACLQGIRDMFTTIESGLDPDHEGARKALRTSRGLLSHCRELLCLQRQAQRGGV